MKIKEFNKLKKDESPESIISKYMKCEIYLTDKQLSEIIKNSKGHGGVRFDYVGISKNGK